ncbi:hypothetical protein vseg_003637 [Gypsophila vaccaria]
MRSILDIKQPPKITLLNNRKKTDQNPVDHPIPGEPKRGPENGPSKNLGNGMVTQINTGNHGESGKGPRRGLDKAAGIAAAEEGGLAGGKEGEVDGEEKHELGVGGGPAVGVAGLEGNAGVGAGLGDCCLDEFVDDLGDEEAQGEAQPLDLPPEEEVGDEPPEGDEHRDQGHPC